MKFLLIIGFIFVYISFGMGLYFITKLINKKTGSCDIFEDDDGLSGSLFVIFWPIILALLAILIPVLLIQKAVELINKEVDDQRLDHKGD